MKPTLFRQTLSTLIYIVVLFFALWADNLLINWALRHFIIPFFDWFYDLNFFIKIIFIALVGTLTAVIIFGIFMWITEMVSRILAYIFIFNKVAYYISIIMVLTNIVFSIIDMWASIRWDFWAIIIWLLIFYFIFQMNWALVFKNRKVLEDEALIKNLLK